MAMILVIEDDNDINRLLCRILEKAGYHPVPAFSGTEAQLRLEHGIPDLILLDLMLPGMSGEELLAHIRNDLKLEAPVIILSAKASLEDKVGTITTGADDYITKPFEPEEVLVRVMAVLRRSSRTSSCTIEAASNYEYKNLILNPTSRTVTVNGQEITLTNYEFDILKLLLGEPEKVFSRDTIYEKVWKNGYYGEDNTVNVHVSNLRKKIAAADCSSEYIKTVWGIGFKLV